MWSTLPAPFVEGSSFFGARRPRQRKEPANHSYLDSRFLDVYVVFGPQISAGIGVVGTGLQRLDTTQLRKEGHLASPVTACTKPADPPDVSLLNMLPEHPSMTKNLYDQEAYVHISYRSLSLLGRPTWTLVDPNGAPNSPPIMRLIRCSLNLSAFGPSG